MTSKTFNLSNLRSFTLQSILVSCFFAVCAVPAAGQARLTGQTMGTYYSIVIDGADDAAVKDVHESVKACLADVNRQMSTWDPASEITQFNQRQTTEWFPVSSEFAEVVQEARRIHTLTAGAFDPTVSPLINLWGFGDQRPKHLPTDAEISEAKRHVGMGLVEVRLQPPGLRKTDPAVQLNLSAIAKGHGVDRVSQLLSDAGFPAHVVDIGGENRAGTAKADGSKWRLGVESPLGGLDRILEVTQTSVATSGDYRNFFEIQGVRYSHAISPVTGRPVEDPPASISVVDESCMTADAFATALMVMGVDRGLELARAENLSVMFQTVDDGQTVVVHATGLFLKEKAEQAAQWWLPFVAAAAIFFVAIIGMAIGALVRNRALKGSCGGLASLPDSDGKSICELCTVPKDECVNSEIREKLTQQTVTD